MKLTFEGLEVLDAIDRKGSFSAAAVALHRVRSTISYTVQKMEEDLGFAIFRREGRRAVLTPAGELLLHQGRELLSGADRILESAHRINSGWESSINIAIDTVWDIEQFYPILAQFNQLNSGVEVSLFEEVMGGSLEALFEDKVDIVIGGPPPVVAMKGYKFESIMQASWQFVVAKNHPLISKKMPLNDDDIKPYRSIIIKDSSTNSAIRSHRSFDHQLKLRVPTMAHKITAIVQGLGIGFLPSHKIKTQLNSGELVALAIDKEAPNTAQYLSWKVSNKGRAVKWFVEQMIEESRRRGKKPQL